MLQFPYKKRSDFLLIFLLLAFLGIGGTSAIVKGTNPPPPVASTPTPSVIPISGNYGLQLKTFYPPTASPTQVLASVPTSLPTLTQQPNPGKLIWSMGYYVGWLQGTYPPQTIPWKDFTHIIHFSLKTNRDGSLQYTHGMTPAYMYALVVEAHKHNVKALLSIGGDDDKNWDGACGSPNTITTFVNNLVSTMQTYGYDGIDLDIEEDPSASGSSTYFGYPTYTGYTACIQQLRNALDKITPRPLLIMAVVPEWQAWMASHAWQYVDYINMMSYGTDASRIGNLINNFTCRGFPKGRLGIGIDFVANANAAWCGGLAQYAVNNSIGGIMEWVLTEDQRQHNGQTPCLDAISPYVPVH